MQISVIIIVFLANACLVGAGIYLSSYLKKKAEGLATKEDFRDLKEQTAELTRTTKKIEAEINEDLWNRQKRWEIKRDVVFDIAKNIATSYDALNAVWACYALPVDPTKAGQPEYELLRTENKAKAAVAWSAASTSYDTALGLAGIICSRELTMALRELMIFMRKVEQKIHETPKHFMDSLEEYVNKSRSVEALLRRELGIDQLSIKTTSLSPKESA
jgi:hypothetical protein